MQVFRGIPERAEHGCVLTIGNFDGVHRGHQALLAKLTDKARVTGLPSAVLTFEPHPREFFAHDNRPRRLTSLREKIQLLAAMVSIASTSPASTRASPASPPSSSSRTC
jgi:riboflavin kinase/FMN adenylyltransferase